MSVGVTRPIHGHHPGAWLPGVPRTDHGDGLMQLVCDECPAGWVGLPGESCWWCEQRIQTQVAEQRAMVLRPELPDPDHIRWPDARRAWGERLARAVQSDLVTEHEAEAAIDRTRR